MSIENTQKKPTYTMPPIKRVIAIGSGKGGVGKSTVTVHLAKAYAAKGYRVGIMDADIYGPSIPHMLATTGKPKIVAESRMMIPHETDGLQSISMGYIFDPKVAASWRGPMASKALFQLFYQTAWDKLDYLFIDMPPGTGDIQLSLASKIPVSGAILVTTPQDISVLDVRKAADLFKKVNVPLLGIIENMSYYEDPTTKQHHFMFGQDGGKHLAQELVTPLLAQIPIIPSIGTNCDRGTVSSLPMFEAIVSTLEKR